MIQVKSGLRQEMSRGLQSPAWPAAWLLFGIVFAFAAAHFLAIPWPRGGAAIIYGFAALWVLALAWLERRHVLAFTALDWLFAGFVLLVVASLVLGGGASGEAGRQPRFIPFMVVIPYLCGRLMRVPDIALLSRITLWAGLAMLPLMLLDRLISPGLGTTRWAFFGLYHTPHLVGALLAASLVVLCVCTLDYREPGTRDERAKRLIYLGLLGLFTFVLVWGGSRGQVLGGLAGVAVVAWSMRTCAPMVRAGLFAYVVGIAAISLTILPSSTVALYSQLLTTPDTTPVAKSRLGPILGEASCQPFKEGVDSAAMRWVLYQEALAMFLENPVLGVGADRFGERSCTGPGWYPHSTILQAFAELGAFGGGLLLGLLAFVAVTLMRPLLSARPMAGWPTYAFALGLFAVFLVTDQFSGTYFMALGVSWMLGFAASLRAQNLRDGSRG